MLLLNNQLIETVNICTWCKNELNSIECYEDDTLPYCNDCGKLVSDREIETVRRDGWINGVYGDAAYED